MHIFIRHKTYESNQSGFAAIIVALIIMALLVLISIGFLQVVNQEQRASLDRQLSSQAFYAAESGVNDTTEIIAEYLNDGNDPPRKEDCELSDSTGADYTYPSLGQLDDAISYTCVLVEPNPETLQYDSVGTEHNKIVFLNAGNADGATNAALGSVVIGWQAAELSNNPIIPGPGTDFPNDPRFSEAAPVLRIALTPISSPTQFSRQQLIDNTYTVFLRPSTSGTNATAYIAGAGNLQNQGATVETQCSTANEPRYCSMEITGLADSNYLLAARSLFATSSMLISPGSSSPSDFRFYGQQAVIDSTGRASDVLRRLQVRVPVRDTFDLPSFALEASAENGSGGICKPYSILPNSGAVVTNSAICNPIN